jgi:hypothetical protein
MTREKLAFRTFEPKSKLQRILLRPVVLVQQRRAGRIILTRRGIRCGRFGLAPGSQVDLGRAHLFVPIGQQLGATSQLVGDIEQLLGESLLRQARQELASNPKVCLRALTFGDERVGGLLDSIV